MGTESKSDDGPKGRGRWEKWPWGQGWGNQESRVHGKPTLGLGVRKKE